MLYPPINYQFEDLNLFNPTFDQDDLNLEIGETDDIHRPDRTKGAGPNRKLSKISKKRFFSLYLENLFLLSPKAGRDISYI